MHILALLDNRAGNSTQTLGVADALNLPYQEYPVSYTALVRLPNIIRGASLTGIEHKAAIRQLQPDIVLATGRRLAPVARAIKRAHPAAFLCQMMHPETGLADFDLLAVPEHDACPPRPNLITTIGAAHRLTPAKLAAAAALWQPKFAHLPRPWLAVLVGGTSKHGVFSPTAAAALGKALRQCAQDTGGSILCTTSRRTGADAATALTAALGNTPSHLFHWGDNGDNPYSGYLACADGLIVTEESVSMLSEAASTAKPVYIYHYLSHSPFARFHVSYINSGIARPFRSTFEQWTYQPPNTAADIAAAIRARCPLLASAT